MTRYYTKIGTKMDAHKERIEMDGKTLREQIVAAELEMFQTTRNKGGRASCQDDCITFYNMRIAQFEAWSDETAESYWEDLEAAKDRDRNLVAEKYLHMMKSTYCDFPSEHWTRIRTNNVIERLNREIRRRMRVVGTFPDGNSALMLVCARLRHVAGTQWGNKKYMNMKHLEAALEDVSIAG